MNEAVYAYEEGKMRIYVNYELDNGLAIVKVNNPPVNSFYLPTVKS